MVRGAGAGLNATQIVLGADFLYCGSGHTSASRPSQTFRSARTMFAPGGQPEPTNPGAKGLLTPRRHRGHSSTTPAKDGKFIPETVSYTICSRPSPHRSQSVSEDAPLAQICHSFRGWPFLHDGRHADGESLGQSRVVHTSWRILSAFS